MADRLALIIGNSEYEDSTLAQLNAPDADVRSLAEALRDPQVGGFDQVTELINQPESMVSRSISTFFAQRKTDDLLLLYFSGHGVLDSQGRLYLAVKDTQHDLLKATAVAAAFITDEMDTCRSKRQILVLDCCHSAAFSRGAKGDSPAVTAMTFEGAGYGKVVLTASSATQGAWDGDQVIQQTKLSLFTNYLIEGLRSGEADKDQDGKIGLDEWYDFAYDRVIGQSPDQTPQRWVYNQSGDLFIARNPSLKPAELPAQLRQAIENPIAEVRLGAIQVLAGLARGSEPALAKASSEALKRLASDDSQRVAGAASEILAALDPAPPIKVKPDIPKPMPEPVVVKPHPEPHQLPWKLYAVAGLLIVGLVVLVLFNSGLFNPAGAPAGPTHGELPTMIPSQAVVIGTSSAQMPEGGNLLATSTQAAEILSPTQTIRPTPQLAALGGGSGWLAFTSNRDGDKEIYLINLASGETKRLTSLPGDDGYPSFSPDGRSILFHSDRAGNFDIYTMNTDGSGLAQLTNNSSADTFPAWSPDGSAIVFQSKRDANREIYWMKTDGTGQLRITSSPSDEERPKWSPDGNRIIFISRRDGNKEIYTMNTDGTDWQRLTNNTSAEDHPSWSPDGTRILFSSDFSGNWEVYTMNPDGTDWKNLSNSPTNDDLPRWSPDGRYIAFASDRNGNTDIFIMKSDGTGLFPLTSTASDDTEPAWQP